MPYLVSRWWFHIYVYFHPDFLGFHDPIWWTPHIFQMGLVKNHQLGMFWVLMWSDCCSGRDFAKWQDPHVGASSVGAPLELFWIGNTCKIIGDIVTCVLAVQYYIIYIYMYTVCTYHSKHISSYLGQYQLMVRVLFSTREYSGNLSISIWHDSMPRNGISNWSDSQVGLMLDTPTLALGDQRIVTNHFTGTMSFDSCIWFRTI